MSRSFWQPADDERLRAFHASTLTADEIALQFEGRTAAGVQARFAKLKLGIRPIARARWSEDEYAVLARIWSEPGTLKSLVARNLPGRTWRAAMDHGIDVLGLPPRGAAARSHSFSWVSIELDRVLTAEPNLAVSEIAARCGGSRVRITSLLAAGHGSKYFKSGWRNGRKTPLWSLGNSPDAGCPEPATPTEINRRWRARKRVRAGHFDPFACLLRQVAA